MSLGDNANGFLSKADELSGRETFVHVQTFLNLDLEGDETLLVCGRVEFNKLEKTHSLLE
jgi:hypothetical protein